MATKKRVVLSVTKLKEGCECRTALGVVSVFEGWAKKKKVDPEAFTLSDIVAFFKSKRRVEDFITLGRAVRWITDIGIIKPLPSFKYPAFKESAALQKLDKQQMAAQKKANTLARRAAAKNWKEQLAYDRQCDRARAEFIEANLNKM